MPITARNLCGRQVNPVGLGCMTLSWAYGTPPSDADGERLLHRALDLGYDHLDTARIYGIGHNETLIGRALKSRRQQFVLASKTGIIVDGEKRRIDCRPETIRTALETSLQLLQTDHIEESVGALADLVKEGKIGAIGLSEMSADTLRKASAVHPIAAMQTEYSPMTRNPEIAVLEACRETGTTFVAFSPVGRGLLADAKLDMDAVPPKDIRRGMPRFQSDNYPANVALAEGFAAIATEHRVTAAQLAMAWVFARGDHVVAIPGTTRLDHLEENIARWDWALPEDANAAIDALINRETVVGNRYAPPMQATIDTEEFV
jgi:aryl-alcohol dehydrogenase-like predicted oxidoreductase